MNVETGIEAAQFLLWEYINRIFVAVRKFIDYRKVAVEGLISK